MVSVAVLTVETPPVSSRLPLPAMLASAKGTLLKPTVPAPEMVPASEPPPVSSSVPAAALISPVLVTAAASVLVLLPDSLASVPLLVNLSVAGWSWISWASLPAKSKLPWLMMVALSLPPPLRANSARPDIVTVPVAALIQVMLPPMKAS